jgi:membrane fusion protein, multidrug efflux system
MRSVAVKLSDPPILPIGAMPEPRQSREPTIPELRPEIEPDHLATLSKKTATESRTSPPESPRQRWWLSLVVLAILVGGGVLLYPQIKSMLGAQRTAPAAPPVREIPVVTAAARRDDMKVYLNGLGTVTGYKTIAIRSRVEGELVNVAFSEGQMVQQGSLLAEIDPRPFQVQLDQAKARLGEAQAALKKAQQSQAREMAQSQLALDESQLLLAQKEEQRLSKLVATRTVTANDWDIAVANRQKCEAQVQATKASLKQTEADYSTNILSAQANALAASTAVQNAEIELSYCRITSPITGRVGLRYVDPGNMIRPTDPNGLAVITQLQPIAVLFPIPQDDIAPVQLKMLAGEKLQVEALDRDFKTKLATGTLEAIDNQVDVNSGTIRLKAVFDNEKNLLFPNQFVNARLLVETQQQVVTVPAAAVQRGPDMNFVFVVKPDSTVDLRTIVTGATEGDRIAIASGLSPDETVVIDGIDKLQKGAKVVVRGQNAASAEGEAPRQAAGDHGTKGS